MHDKILYTDAPPTIKACIMHPGVISAFTCERPGNEKFIRVSYGMCFPCTVQLESNMDYIIAINREIDKRLTELQEDM